MTRDHFGKAAVMWEGGIRVKDSLICLFVCLGIFTCNEASKL